MRPSRAALFLLVSTLATASPAMAEMPHPEEAMRMNAADAFRAADELARAAIDDGSLPSVAFAVARDGEILHEGAFGFADRERGIAATTRTPYPLASATKPITATALLRLAGDAADALDAPIAQALPGVRLRGAPTGGPTLAQLLSHTGGLGTYARIRYGDDAATAPDVRAAAAAYGVLVNPPGVVAEYSNLGYGLLGDVVAARHGTSLDAALRDLVFAPLDMADAFVDAPGPGQAAAAVHYDAALAPLPPLRNDTPGAGNVYASARDMIRFAAMHAGRCADAPLTCAQVERMRGRADAAFHHYYGDAHYGLGWYVRDDGGHRSAWHEGGMPGASTLVQVLPDQGVAVVVLINRSDANDKAQALAATLLRGAVPGFEAERIDPVEAYALYPEASFKPDFFGTWKGRLAVGDAELDCGLDARPAGLHLRCDEGGTTWVDGDFGAMLHRSPSLGSLVGALPGRLPGAPNADHQLLLVKLVRDGDTLRGALVAYAGPNRLEYLLPFPLVLQRATRSAPPPADGARDAPVAPDARDDEAR